MTREHCLDMAAEADRLADLVSYGRDKMRLREQADAWREKADASLAQDAEDVLPATGGGGPFSRLLSRLLH